MEFIVVIGTIIALAVLYFLFGIALRFLWGWWILVVCTPLCILIGFALGWFGAIAGILGFAFAVWANNEWHSASAFLNVGAKIDNVFNLGDT